MRGGEPACPHGFWDSSVAGNFTPYSNVHVACPEQNAILIDALLQTQPSTCNKTLQTLAEAPRYDIASAARARRTMAEVQSSSRSQQAYAIGAAKRALEPSRRPQSKRDAPAPLPRLRTAARRGEKVLAARRARTRLREPAHHAAFERPRHPRRARRPPATTHDGYGEKTLCQNVAVRTPRRGLTMREPPSE